MKQFQSLYFAKFREELELIPEPYFVLLEGVFCDLDMYTDDPELLNDDTWPYLNEAEVRRRLKVAQARLQLLDRNAI